MLPVAAAIGAVGSGMGALYTGRGPVCGITMRRAGNAVVGDAVCVCPCVRCAGADSAVGSGSIADPAAAASMAAVGVSAAGAACCTTGATSGTEGAAATGSATTGAATAAGGLTATAGCSVLRGCSSFMAGITGGFTTTAIGGGATTTTGRATETAPAGALATTGPLGGREAIAGGGGGMVTLVGAERGWGTILRGSGFAGCTGAAAAETATTGGAGGAGFAGTTAGGLAGMRLCRASSSSFCLLARMAFITSPGLEMWERSIFGVMPCGAREAEALPWPAGFEPRSKCARTLSAS